MDDETGSGEDRNINKTKFIGGEKPFSMGKNPDPPSPHITTASTPADNDMHYKIITGEQQFEKPDPRVGMLESQGIKISKGDEWLLTEAFKLIDHLAGNIEPGDLKALNRRVSQYLHPDSTSQMDREQKQKLLALFNGVIRDPQTKEMRVPPVSWIGAEKAAPKEPQNPRKLFDTIATMRQHPEIGFPYMDIMHAAIYQVGADPERIEKFLEGYTQFLDNVRSTITKDDVLGIVGQPGYLRFPVSTGEMLMDYAQNQQFDGPNHDLRAFTAISVLRALE